MGPLMELAEDIHETAKTHGWWEEPRSFGDLIALIHSEVSEALEAYREGNGTNYRWFGEDNKPEGVPSELADIIIRVLDICAWYRIDIDADIASKMRYNDNRAFRHGGKAL